MTTTDAINNQSPLDNIPLNWVGMSEITLPFKILSPSFSLNYYVPVKISAYVNLLSGARGIHMSRMYSLLQDFAKTSELSEQNISDWAERIRTSQLPFSDSVKLEFLFSMPLEVETLKSGLKYQKLYPLKMIYQKSDLKEEFSYEIKLDYSSTCPQSAALSHEYFLNQVKAVEWNSSEQLVTWIKNQGLLATPHAQRSELCLNIVFQSLAQKQSDFNFLMSLMQQIENVIGTPTQGMVKRVDEQEFAVRNASNLMFCEDAARKIKNYLDQLSMIDKYHGSVSHIESLHSHNAVCYFSKLNTL